MPKNSDGKKVKMTKIRICPKCKKPKLKAAFNVSGWLAPDMYECDCGYIGQFYIEIDSDEIFTNGNEIDEKKSMDHSDKKEQTPSEH